MGLDVEKTGKCRFTMADETYRNFLFAYVLPKGSPFADSFRLEYVSTRIINFLIWILTLCFRFLKAQAAGLRPAKKTKEETNAERCIGNYHKISADDGYPLTLKNLGSAFILLPVGLLLSFLIFCVEKLVARERGT